jgi:hypothetical protein
MNDLEKAKFLDAVAEAAKLLELSQSALQRARAQCDGDLYERLDVLSKRAYEIKVKSEWLRHSVLGKIDLPIQQRHAADRRVGIDRRIVGMLKQMLSVGSG